MKILVYPYDKSPYLEMLYSSIKRKDNKVVYLNKIFKKQLPSLFVLPAFPFFLLFYRLIGFKTFHLHWQSFNLPLIRRLPKISFFYSIFCIKSIKFFGFKLVWTIHNLLPHEKATSDDLAITSILCTISDAKIVHSNETIKDMRKLKLDTKNTFVIPIGSFVGFYPNNFKNTKKILGIPEKDFVFLFFGNIRPYKGIPELLKSFSQLNKENKRLLIVGNCWDNYLERLLKESSKKDTRIIFKKGFIKDEEIQIYMNASDITIFPFRKVTTTSSILSAASFKKPSISPIIGNIKEMPLNIGIFYDTNNKNGLLDSMKEAISSKNLDKIGKNAYTYAKSLSWENISKRTLDVYIEMINKK